MAVVLLRQQGHEVYPVNPALTTIEGIQVYPELAALPAKVDTVTLYLGPARQESLAAELLAALPRRVIFNPGTENEELAAQLRQAGIETLEACTLVMLKTGVFG